MDTTGFHFIWHFPEATHLTRFHKIKVEHSLGACPAVCTCTQTSRSRSVQLRGADRPTAPQESLLPADQLNPRIKHKLSRKSQGSALLNVWQLKEAQWFLPLCFFGCLAHSTELRGRKKKEIKLQLNCNYI